MRLITYMSLFRRWGLMTMTIICFSHCKKFVEIAPPTTQLVTASVFDNNSAATAAQLAIYSNMVSNKESSTMELNTGLLGDELTNYSNSTSNIQFYRDAMTATETSGPWASAYQYIYDANAIIAALQNNVTLSSAVQQQLSGEAKFIRGFWLFYLTNLYGDIPLVTTTSYTTNVKISRTPKAQVYQQIISDLSGAESLLSANYIDGTDTAITTERTRPTKWAAAALLARVYLFTGDYADAKAQATSVINNNLYRLLGLQNDSVFTANSQEAIWQLAIPLPNSFDTPDGFNFILTSGPGTGNCCTLSPQLLGSFEPGDNRRTYWVDSLAGTNFYYPFKYQIFDAPVTTEYVMVLRLAEQYLIRAEAETQLNDLTDAATDLNVIRNRAGLSSISDSIASSQTAMVSAILHERQVELFTEWGFRWIDLARSGIGNSVMSVVAPLKGGTWNSDGYQLLFPIPLSEIKVDDNLSQNSGY
jgi:starch-binding outer membrane protein, SusD/RagB family